MVGLKTRTEKDKERRRKLRGRRGIVWVGANNLGAWKKREKRNKKDRIEQKEREQRGREN